MTDDTTRAQWKAIDELRSQVTSHAQLLAVLRREQELMREENSRLFGLVSKIDAKLDTLHADITSAKGGLRFGKWLAGILLALLGIAASLFHFGSN